MATEYSQNHLQTAKNTTHANTAIQSTKASSFSRVPLEPFLTKTPKNAQKTSNAFLKNKSQ